MGSLISSGSLGSVKSENFDCVSCQISKSHTLPFSLNDSISSAPFDMIHSDIWGPAPHDTIGGLKYYVIFVDDFSRYTWIYLMRNRSELFSVYSRFANMIQTQFSCKIKIFRTDNAMEYKDTNFIQFLAQQGTILQRSFPGTS